MKTYFEAQKLLQVETFNFLRPINIQVIGR